MSARQTAFRGEAPQGLPGKLPEGEQLLWQGVPDWRTVAQRVFHVRGLALYFGAIAAWSLASGLMGGAPVLEVAVDTGKVVGAGMVPILFLTLYSWGVGRSTVYSITNKRVVLQMGLVVPMTINVPFSKIESASMRDGKAGNGDICLALRKGDRLAWFMLWPHARPWRMAVTEPSLRAIPDVAHVGQVLGRALAASAEMPAPVMTLQDQGTVGAQAPVAA